MTAAMMQDIEGRQWDVQDGNGWENKNNWRTCVLPKIMVYAKDIDDWFFNSSVSNTIKINFHFWVLAYEQTDMVKLIGVLWMHLNSIQ